MTSRNRWLASCSTLVTPARIDTLSASVATADPVRVAREAVAEVGLAAARP